MDALKTLTDDKKIQHSMVNDVFLAVGKLTNTIVRKKKLLLLHTFAFSLYWNASMRCILFMFAADELIAEHADPKPPPNCQIMQGLSWEWDHVKNLSKVGEMHAENMNCNGLKHRHTHMHKKAWVVLEKLGRLMTIVKAPDWKDISESVESVHASYIEFFVYLVYTSQIVLEDALFFYRSQLKENEVSSVGRAAARHSAYDELLDWALNIIVGATPKNQRHERLQAMGYDWMRARIVSLSCARIYQRKFVKPLDAIISAVHSSSQQACSRSGRSSMSENDTKTLQEMIRRDSPNHFMSATQIRRNSFVTLARRLSIDKLPLARASVL